MEKINKETAYFLAKHRTERLRKFYIHCIVYGVVNIVLVIVKVLRNIDNGETFSQAFFDFSTFGTAIVWGVILGIHAISVFGVNILFGNQWEENKLKKFMEEDEKLNRN